MKTPNILTVLTVFMIPLFIGAFLIEGISDWITLVIFASAAITDALDGYIARKKNIVTDFGKLMDPLADKIMVMSAFVCFTAAGILHPIITIVILAREFLITGLRSIATSKGKVIAADIWGKAKTVSQYAFIIVTLIRRSVVPGLEGFFGIIATFTIVVALILATISAVHYCIKYKEFFKDN